jgi:hypothetical protein
MITYSLAIGGDTTLRDIDVALACGQQDILISVGTPIARHLRGLPGVNVVLDSAAWPIDNPERPSFDAWWQMLRSWRQGRQDYGNLVYAMAYDTIGQASKTEKDYNKVMGRINERCPDLPIVPVLGHGLHPSLLSIDVLQGWAFERDDLVDGDGTMDRPFYALGGLVPERGSKRSVEWVKQVAHELAYLADEEGIDPEFLGIHLLGSSRTEYITPLCEVGVEIWCDNSTPMRQARAGDASLSWAYTDKYGLPMPLLQRSRFARIAFWLCRERDKLGLDYTVPDHAWIEELPNLTPAVKVEQFSLFDMPAEPAPTTKRGPAKRRPASPAYAGAAGD